MYNAFFLSEKTSSHTKQQEGKEMTLEECLKRNIFNHFSKFGNTFDHE